MINKKLFFIPLSFSIFLIGCSNNKIVKNDSNEQIQNESSFNLASNVSPNYANFKGFNMPQDNVNFMINGKTLQLKQPVYLYKNRYYICLNEFIEKLTGKIETADNLINITIDNKLFSIDFKTNTITSFNDKFVLKKSILKEDNIYYISFSDFSNMLNLYTRWNKDNKIINCKLNGFENKNFPPYEAKINQIGLIRFEDIGLNSQHYSKEYFEKLRIISNYMYQKKIPYHIAWIPRYVLPSQGIDYDPTSSNNFETAEMVYSLDYFTSHNGIIGLHGYTHQCGNSESGAGFEFGKYNPSEQEFKEKIEKALKTASYLDIPIDFFEAPHYEITPAQNKIAEKYFKILYYPFNDYGEDKADLKKPQLSPYNKSSLYISTPLDYIPIGKEDAALAKIKKTDTDKMGSVFFHPSLESNYISLTADNNAAPNFTYADNSILKRLINLLEDKGFKIIKVIEL